MKRRILAAILGLSLIFALASCTRDNSTATPTETAETTVTSTHHPESDPNHH